MFLTAWLARVLMVMTISGNSFQAAGWRLDHSYARLPDVLFAALPPEPVSRPRLVLLNRSLAGELGLDPEMLTEDEAASVFAGNTLPPGAKPIAQAYAGHQYGHFTVLGDGRAILLGEQITPDGRRCDVQLKGSGRTPFSRGGDGRAALGPMLREFIVSEAMHALGIPTTRSLAVVATGDEIYRRVALPGAVLTRVAASHIRVGTMEWAAAQPDPQVLEALVRYTLERHFPEHASEASPGLALLEAVIDRQAALIARWQSVGFVHGVMNTDNMALSGETIDYGPCAFMEAYDPATVFSSIDRFGRYAYGNQPSIAQWNLARLAEALLPVIDSDASKALDQASAAVYSFPDRFQRHWQRLMTGKLGLASSEPEDLALVNRLLAWMQQTRSDFTNTFAGLTTGVLAPGQGDTEFDSWHQLWRERLGLLAESPAATTQRLRAANPAVIPRNHLVEDVLETATRTLDLTPLRAWLEVLTDPFNHDRIVPAYQAPAPSSDPPYRTFCGT